MNKDIISIKNCDCKINHDKENNRVDFVFDKRSPEKFKQILFETFDTESVYINKKDDNLIFSIDVKNEKDVFDAIVRLQD